MRRSILAAALVTLVAGQAWAGTRLDIDFTDAKITLAKAEATLGNWLKRRVIRKELALAQARADFLATHETDELRDSIASAEPPASVKHAALRRINSGMPPAFWSLTAPHPETCLSLSDCATPPLALDIVKAEDIPAAILTLLRPWLLLEQAGKTSLRLTADKRTNGHLFDMDIEGLPDGPAGLRLATKPNGKGYRIWFEDGLVLAAFFESRRLPLL